MPRPDRLPKSAEKIIKASKLLPCGMKLLWIEDYWLDSGPEGSYVSHENMGVRLGMAPNVIETYRTRMRRAGLYQSAGKSWYATLPAVLMPLPGKLDWKTARHVASRLDGYFEALKANDDKKAPPGLAYNRTPNPYKRTEKVGTIVREIEGFVAPATSMNGGDLGGASTSDLSFVKASTSSCTEKQVEVATQEAEVEGAPSDVMPLEPEEYQRRLTAKIEAMRAERAAKRPAPTLRPSARDPLPEGKY